MIHLNSGQASVARFLESLDLTLNDIHEYFKACDIESLGKAMYRGKGGRSKTRDKSGDKYYQPGGVD